jgi:DDE superfamily endonuclease
LFGLYSISQLYLSDLSIWIPRLPLYTELILDSTYGAATNVFGFIDGTLCRISCPTYIQRQAYSGHKRFHGMKFQSVYGPEGFYLHLYGPLAGCRHDSFLLGESGLLDELQQLFPNGEYSIFGDPAYPNRAWLWGNYHHPWPGVEEEFNKTMSSVRELSNTKYYCSLTRNVNRKVFCKGSLLLFQNDEFRKFLDNLLLVSYSTQVFIQGASHKSGNFYTYTTEPSTGFPFLFQEPGHYSMHSNRKSTPFVPDYRCIKTVSTTTTAAH